MSKIKLFLVLISALFIFYFPVIFQGKSLQPALYQPHGLVDGWPVGYDSRTPANTFNIDLATPAYYEWPINRLVGNLYKGFIIPLWNPYQGAGTPLSAQYSSRAFFPYQVIENISPVWAWDFFLLGRVLIAGFFTCLFLDLLGLSTLASVFGGLAYMFSGAFTWFINLEQFTNSAMMLPVHLFCLERLARDFTLKDVSLAALSTGLVLLAGQPEIAFLILFLGAAYYSVRILFFEKEKVAKRLFQYLLVNLLGLGLALPQVLPFMELMDNSHHLHTVDDGIGTRDPLKGFEALRILSPTVSETPQSENRSAAKGYTPAGEEFYFRIFPDNGAWDRLGGYAGIISVLLPLVSLGFAQSRKQMVFLIFFLTFGLSIILKNFGIRPFIWIGELPLFNQVWTQRWAGPIWTFCLGAAAAFGIEAVRQAVIGQKAAKKAFLFIAAVFILTLSAYAVLGYQYISRYAEAASQFKPGASFFEGLRIISLVKPYFGPNVLMGTFVTALFLIMTLLIIFISLRKKRGLYALVSLLALELWWSIPRGYEPAYIYLKLIPFAIGIVAVIFFLFERWRLAAFGVLAFALSFSALDWKAEKGFPVRHDPFSKPGYVNFLEKNAETYRVMGAYGMLFPNYASAVGIQDIRFINSLAIDSYYDYKNIFLQNEDFPVRSLWFTGRKTDLKRNSIDLSIEEDIFSKLKYYSFLGVKYFIFPPGFDLEEKRVEYSERTGKVFPSFTLAYSGQDAVIYENPVVFPRAFVIGRASAAGSYTEAQAGLDLIDLATEVLVEGERPPLAALANSAAMAGRAEVTGYSPNRVMIDAYSPDGGILVLTDSYYKGWKAHVDGKPSSVVRVNGVVRGVYLEPGNHKVEFSYLPASFIIGCLASIISLLVILFLLAAGRWKKIGSGHEP